MNIIEVNYEKFSKSGNQPWVIKRYLHIFALLQKNEEWTANKLADILYRDEPGKGMVTDKTVRETYIKKYLVNEMGLDIHMEKGERGIYLNEQLEKEKLVEIAKIYSSFIIADTSRDMILRNLLNKFREKGKPGLAIWMLARIYFAKIERKKISFNYTSNTAKKQKNYIVNPYHLVFRNNNLYLITGLGPDKNIFEFIVNKITDVEVLDSAYEEDPPSIDDIFKYTLGSYIGNKNNHMNVKIRYKKNRAREIDQLLSILDPEVKEIDDGEMLEAAFTIADDRYLCKQLFQYGSDVKIIEPESIRNTMIEMLEESISAYRNG